MKRRHFMLNLQMALRSRAVRVSAAASVAALLLSMSLAAAYWWPTYRAHRDLANDVAQVREQVLARAQNATLVQAYRSASIDIQRIESKLDAAGGQAALVQALAKNAQEHGVKVVSEAYQEAKARDVYRPLMVEMKLQGRYAAIRAFLTGLAHLPQWVAVNDAEFARGDHGDVTAQLRLVTYRRATVR